jgi:hypothetical protein
VSEKASCEGSTDADHLFLGEWDMARTFPRNLLVACAFAAGCFFVSTRSHAAVIYSTPGSTYTQTFDSLPTAPTNVSIQATTPWKDDDINGVTATQVSIPGWYLYHPLIPTGGETGTNGHQRFRIGTGSSNTGSFYGYGIAGVNAVTDRALGDLGSTTLASNPPGNQDMVTGLLLTNNNAYSLTEFTVTYTGEQWRQNGNTVSDSIFLSYFNGDGTTFDNGPAFTSLPTGTFTSPVVGAVAATLDGNAAANRITGITATVSGIFWTPGTSLMIRWNDLQIAANDHGLAIDDVTFTATPEPGTVGLLLGATLLSGLRRRR